MAFVGMDIEQVQNLSRQLNQKASDIDNIISTLNSTLQGTEWKGQVPSCRAPTGRVLMVISSATTGTRT